MIAQQPFAMHISPVPAKIPLDVTCFSNPRPPNINAATAKFAS